MRIANVMTRNVQSLGPETTLVEAARRMRDLDVGAIPVTRDGRPVGIVTDRDVTVRATADGRDPAACTVAEVMTADAVTVNTGDDTEDAAEVMKARQVRRLMVVDDAGTLCGIVSLGDLSLRTHDDELAEDTLEEVSWPGHPRDGASGGGGGGGGGGRFEHEPGMGPRRARPMMRQARAYLPEGGAAAAGAGAGIIGGLAAGLLIGAGLAYIFDPRLGRTRRAMARDQFYSTARHAGDRARKQGRRVRHQAYGLAAEARRALTPDEANDETIGERVRAALGRAVSHPHAIGTDVYNGVVTLTGPILTHEVPELMRTVIGVRGVRDVINELECHDTNEGVPALQGGRL